MRDRRFRLGLVIAVCLFGCGLGERVESAEENLFLSDAAVRFVRQLEERLGSPPRLMQLYVYEGVVWADVLDPKKPSVVSRFELRGGVLKNVKPDNTVLRFDPPFELYCFSPTEARLEAFPVLAQEALRRLKLKGGEVLSISVLRDLPDSKELRITVVVSGDDEMGKLVADAQGNVLRTGDYWEM